MRECSAGASEEDVTETAERAALALEAAVVEAPQTLFLLLRALQTVGPAALLPLALSFLGTELM